jgi:hypothetical protein
MTLNSAPETTAALPRKGSATASMIKRPRIIDRESLARHSGTVAGFVLSIRNFMLVSPSGKNGSSRSVKISVVAMLGKGENKGQKAQSPEARSSDHRKWADVLESIYTPINIRVSQRSSKPVRSGPHQARCRTLRDLPLLIHPEGPGRAFRGFSYWPA